MANWTEVKEFDPTKVSEAAMEKAAIRSEMNLQDYNDRVAMGQLTEQEKKARKNTEAFADYLNKVGTNVNMDDVKNIFE